jgi:hypothetical protein
MFFFGIAIGIGIEHVRIALMIDTDFDDIIHGSGSLS